MSAWGDETGGAGATPYRLTVTPAMIRAGGTEQSIRWSTDLFATANRIAAVRCFVNPLFDFTIAAPGSTITLDVLNDNGDVLYTRAIDVAHGVASASAIGEGALPLVIGPYAEQGDTTYYFRVSTDAASLSLVKAAVGDLWVEVEIVTMAPTVTVSTTPA